MPFSRRRLILSKRGCSRSPGVHTDFYSLSLDLQNLIRELPIGGLHGCLIAGFLANQRLPQRRDIADLALARVSFCRTNDMELLRLIAIFLYSDHTVQVDHILWTVVLIVLDDPGAA